MSDTRSHRGLHPEDEALFSPSALPRLRAATADLSWLLEHGYQLNSALKLCGDRYRLTARQRAAVARCACPVSRADARQSRMRPAQTLVGHKLQLDGFNVLTTLEVALSGGVVLIGRDTVMRDIAGVHGSYRSVEETLPALDVLARVTTELRISHCEWLLDAPVSNSGRLCETIRELAQRAHLPWEARAVADPDTWLKHSAEIVASADGEILDAAPQHCNLARICIERCVPQAFVVDLSESGDVAAAYPQHER